MGSVLRFLWLDKVPPAIGGDELVYILTAKFVFLRWTDILGTWNPLSVFIFHYPFDQFQAELPYFLLLSIFKFLPIVAGAKFAYSLISIFTIIIIYFLTKELFGKKTALIASFVAAINPWFIFIGRTAYESVPATFFYLFSIYFLLKAKNWKILWSIPILALAFYSYIGTKLIFFPFVLMVLLFVFYRNKKRFLKQYLTVGLFSLALVVFFFFTIKSNPSLSSSRTSNIFSVNNPEISQMVDKERKATINNCLVPIFENKLTAFSGQLITKVFTTLSSNYLFLEGDNFYSVYSHGLFYPIDAIFLLFGLLFIFAKERKNFYFFFSLIILSLVPQFFYTFSEANFTPHIVLFFPFLIILIAYGIANISQLTKGKIILVLIVVAYGISLANFINIYFYQYPLRETFDFRIRLLAKYIELAGNSEKISIYNPRSADTFMKYIFYADSINKNSADKISSALKNNRYILGNVVFTDCNKFDFSKNVSILDYSCGDYGSNVKHISIANLSDGFGTFRIYNDKVCKGIGLDPFPMNIKLSNFSVENLSREDFCKAYITSNSN